MIVRAWNCKVGARPSFVTELRGLGAPHVLALLETGGHRRHIKQWAVGHGYRIVSGSGIEGASTQLLTSAPVIASGVIRFTTRWVGPKGRPHAGRAFPWAKVEADGRHTIVVAVHMPWNRRRNRRAWRRAFHEIRQFTNAHPGADLLIVGDLNIAASKRGPGSMRALARRIGGTVVTTGATVDYGIYRPARRPLDGPQRPVVVTGTKGRRLNSDHPIVTYATRSA